MPPWFRYLFYEFSWMITFAVLTLFWSLRIQGQRRIPRTGPALIIANHESYFDPIMVGLASRRHLSFLARKTLFRNPLVGWVLSMLNGVPIDQEGVGKEGLKTILGRLQLGDAVVVFPEGNRTATGELQALRPGIVLLIKRVQAPIVPVGIAGAYAAWPRTHHLPTPSPLFLPASPRTLAASVGRALDGSRYAAMPREAILAEMLQELLKVEESAQRLRRK
jgi:1-acyl-sn-glycerol-3-phosphate acyltransferase